MSACAADGVCRAVTHVIPVLLVKLRRWIPSLNAAAVDKYVQPSLHLVSLQRTLHDCPNLAHVGQVCFYAAMALAGPRRWKRGLRGMPTVERLLTRTHDQAAACTSLCESHCTRRSNATGRPSQQHMLALEGEEGGDGHLVQRRCGLARKRVRRGSCHGVAALGVLWRKRRREGGTTRQRYSALWLSTRWVEGGTWRGRRAGV